MAMICQFCGKTFHKGEHLRRHERGHTGQRPFTCPHCNRSFSRQDSLLRHQKVHNKKGSENVASEQLDPMSQGNGRVSRYTDVRNVRGFNGDHEPSSKDTVQSDSQNVMSHTEDSLIGQPGESPNFQYNDTLGFQNDNPLSDIDLALMWPDSEDLFQSIFSNHFNESWQLPPGTLPLPPTPFTSTGLPVALAADTIAQSTSSIHRNANLVNCNTESSEGQLRSGDNQVAVSGVSQMVSNYSSSLTAAVESKSITSVFLDECLHMFFDRFIPIFPIMHRPTFVYRDCSHSLLLNAIALGSLYLGPADSVAKGETLWRLAHTAVATSWQTLITHRGPYDACPGVQLVLSSLLSVVYGALSKSTAIRSASQALHASAFFWARQCGIFKCEPYNLSDLPLASTPQADKVHQWRLWVAREIQQRALLSHFVLDGLIAHMQGNATSVRHTSNTLRLPHSERAFQDTNVEDWLQSMRAIQQDPNSFRDIYKLLFQPSDGLWAVTSAFSNLSLRVLLEALQSIVADSDEHDGAIVHPPDSTKFGNALSWIYEKISNCSDIHEVERLEVKLRWHAVCLEAVVKTPQLCNYICKRWNVHQYLWPNNNLRDQEYDLSQLINSSDGRKALLHAIAIQNIVEQLPRGRAHAVHMPSSLFAAATIYGAFSFIGQTSVRMPSLVEWKDVVLAAQDLENLHHETAKFIQGNGFAPPPASVASRNVLYELNSVQKLLNGISTQWGVSADMEKVVSQWIALCHS